MEAIKTVIAEKTAIPTLQFSQNALSAKSNPKAVASMSLSVNARASAEVLFCLKAAALASSPSLAGVKSEAPTPIRKELTAFLNFISGKADFAMRCHL